jgi:hypothetical protein
MPLLQFEPPAHSFPRASRSSEVLQQLTEKPCLPAVTAASRLAVRPAPDTASSGIAPIDALTGGLPRGCLTEVCGPDSSGRTSLMLSALAAATRREEICALIDVSDAFDPHSAAAAHIELERLLWVRCGATADSSALSRKRRPAASLEERERRRMEDPVEQALRAADLLLQSSGFGMVVLDLAGVSLKMARRIPLTTWFRFRRAIENTPTILLAIGTQSCAQSCASLSLKLSHQEVVLSSRFSGPRTQYSVISTQCSEEFSICNDDESPARECSTERPSHAELLTGIQIRTEVLRSRTDRKPVHSANSFETKTAWTA